MTAQSNGTTKIYVASSWRNPDQPAVVAALRAAGHLVYDFRNPHDGDHGFSWSDIDPNWQDWTPEQFRDALEHPIAKHGFRRDEDAMRWADVCVLVMPCGRSAHTELGWFCGAGKGTILLLDDGEPELMYGFVDHLCVDIGEVIAALAELADDLGDGCCVSCGRDCNPGAPPDDAGKFEYVLDDQAQTITKVQAPLTSEPLTISRLRDDNESKRCEIGRLHKSLRDCETAIMGAACARDWNAGEIVRMGRDIDDLRGLIRGAVARCTSCARLSMSGETCGHCAEDEPQ